MKECLIEEIKALIRENDMFGTYKSYYIINFLFSKIYDTI